MQRAKYNNRHYFSIQSILASEEQLKCSFLRDENYIGFLEAGNNTNKITAGTNLQLPYWIAKVFAPYPTIVTIDLPKPFKKVYRDILTADAIAVDVKTLFRFFYLLGEYVCKLNHRETSELKEILIQTFRTRFRMIMDWSLNNSTDQSIKKLDFSETCIYESGRSSQIVLDKWLKEGSSAILATAMITSHKKRKVTNEELL